MLTFQKTYFFAAISLFLLEAAIALFVRDAYLRPYGGDVLVVIFLYCLLKAFFKIPVKKAIFGVLLFSFLIEVLQLFGLPEKFGLEENQVISVVLGSHFEWLDLFMYLLGAGIVLLTERAFGRTSKLVD